MIELTGDAYLEMIGKLDSEGLLCEFIKQTVVANTHFKEVSANGEKFDEDIVFRYNAIANEVFQRLEK